MTRAAVLTTACLAAAGIASAQPPLPDDVQTAPQRSWGPEQATGAPDTFEAGDRRTAWATATQDAPDEWLELAYDLAVPVDHVCIGETYNPGAVCKVSAFTADDAEVETEVVIWEGDDPTTEAPGEFIVVAEAEVVSRRLKVYLDSVAVPGWNEIDAVELVGKDGSRQWAAAAQASSTYAERGGERFQITGRVDTAAQRPLTFAPRAGDARELPAELADLLWMRVTVHVAEPLETGDLSGVVAWVDPQFRSLVLDLEQQPRRLLISTAAVQYIEPGPGPHPRSMWGFLPVVSPERELPQREVEVALRNSRPWVQRGTTAPGYEPPLAPPTVLRGRVTALGPEWRYVGLEIAEGTRVVIPWSNILTIAYDRPDPREPVAPQEVILDLEPADLRVAPVEVNTW